MTADGANHTELIRSMLSQAAATPEQQALLDLVLSMVDTDENEAGGADPAELADLRQVNDTLAAALGACPLCWGGDDQCTACDGRGRPGSSRPDHELFAELVVPAVERLGWPRRRARPVWQAGNNL